MHSDLLHPQWTKEVMKHFLFHLLKPKKWNSLCHPQMWGVILLRLLLTGAWPHQEVYLLHGGSGSVKYLAAAADAAAAGAVYSGSAADVVDDLAVCDSWQLPHLLLLIPSAFSLNSVKYMQSHCQLHCNCCCWKVLHSLVVLAVVHGCLLLLLLLLHKSKPKGSLFTSR